MSAALSANTTQVELKLQGHVFDIAFELATCISGPSGWVFAGNAKVNLSLSDLIGKLRGPETWPEFSPDALPVTVVIETVELRCQGRPSMMEMRSDIAVGRQDGLNVKVGFLFRKQTVAADRSAIVLGVASRGPISLGAIAGSDSGIVGQFLDGLTLDNIGAHYASSEVSGLPAGLSFSVRFGKPDMSVDLAFPPPRRPPPPAGTQPAPVVESAPAGSGPKRFWMQLDKTIGPLELRRIGGEWDNGKIAVLLDAAVALAGLRVGLTGLGVKVAPSRLSELKFEDLEFSLDGLAVGFTREPVSISGALLKYREGERIGYAGQAMIRVKTFSIAAIGGYTATDDNQPSFFIFGAVTGLLVGPPAFAIQGIAAGFGYNRALVLPDVTGVRDFPLVSLVLGSPGGGAASSTDQFASEKHFPPISGQYWLAAGIKFSSFKLVEGFALLTVQFGTRFEIALLGVATLRQPPEPATFTLVFIELALKVRFAPDDGLLSVMAVLAANSYLFDPGCRLTGGFAFCVWFAPTNPAIDNRAGDFVFCLGGYHPRFKVPAHYPRVPRVGFNWDQSRVGLTIKGEAYFALTPSFIMAGALLSAAFRSGDFAAWFEAKANFLIGWAPLYYEADVSVRIGASFVLRVGGVSDTLAFELSAALKIWGPPFAGEVTIDLTIVSFTVPIGAHDTKGQVPLLKWNGFAEQFLPRQPLTITITAGLLSEAADRSGTAAYAIVNPSEFAVSIEAFIPLTRLGAATVEDFEERLGIRPIGQTRLPSALEMTCLRDGNQVPTELLSCPEIRKNVPEALWSRQPMSASDGNAALESRVIDNVPMGIAVQPAAARLVRQIAVELGMPEVLHTQARRPAQAWQHAAYQPAAARAVRFRRAWQAPELSTQAALRAAGFAIAEDACDLAQTDPASAWLATPAEVPIGQLLSLGHGA